MGAVYNEDEELDFTFFRQSVRQRPRGTAAGRRMDERGRDQMADMVSGRWQGSVGQSRSGQGQLLQEGGRQAPSARGRSGQSQASGTQVRTSQAAVSQKQAGKGRNRQIQSVQSRSRQGQAPTKRSQTMQEKQSQRQAALIVRRKRRLRRQKQLLAVLLCILLAGTVFASFRLLQEGVGPDVKSETGGQNVAQVQAEGGGNDIVLGTVQGISASQYNQHPDWSEEFLTISEYSRPGEPLEEVNNIFVHYTANPNTSAAQNRNYFENLKDNHDVPGASAHFIIGINGEILQLVPLDEIAYAVQTRNQDSISIECCYKKQNGQFTQETYDSLIELLAWLVNTYELEPDDILRHYDCGGKKCPLYYVDHEDAWRILKRDVGDRIALMQ